jgi:hypothetical protein
MGRLSAAEQHLARQQLKCVLQYILLRSVTVCAVVVCGRVGGCTFCGWYACMQAHVATVFCGDNDVYAGVANVVAQQFVRACSADMLMMYL